MTSTTTKGKALVALLESETRIPIKTLRASRKRGHPTVTQKEVTSKLAVVLAKLVKAEQAAVADLAKALQCTEETVKRLVASV